MKLADIEAREKDSVVQSVELKNDIQASLVVLAECAQDVETEMMGHLRKDFSTSTQIGQSPFGSKIDTFLSELRMLLNSPAPARNQLTEATETVCSWFQVDRAIGYTDETHLSLKSNYLFVFYFDLETSNEKKRLCQFVDRA
jgi:hypothetical protein